MQSQSDMHLSQHRHALLALGIVLASTVISARPLPDVTAAESSGALDASFGTAGKVTTDFGGSGGFARSVAVQPNGKIVAAGGTFLTRYKRDGTLDATFGTGGIVTVTTDGLLL